jgi:hypothetical protein
MSKIISTTIREDDIPTYNKLRKFLDNEKISMGSFIISSFQKSLLSSSLDGVRS